MLFTYQARSALSETDSSGDSIFSNRASAQSAWELFTFGLFFRRSFLFLNYPTCSYLRFTFDFLSFFFRFLCLCFGFLMIMMDDSENYEQLLKAMGFCDENEIRQALQISNNDINEAVAILTNEKLPKITSLLNSDADVEMNNDMMDNRSLTNDENLFDSNDVGFALEETNTKLPRMI